MSGKQWPPEPVMNLFFSLSTLCSCSCFSVVVLSKVTSVSEGSTLTVAPRWYMEQHLFTAADKLTIGPTVQTLANNRQEIKFKLLIFSIWSTHFGHLEGRVNTFETTIHACTYLYLKTHLYEGIIISERQQIGLGRFLHVFLLLFCWFLCMSFSILVLCICFVSVLIALSYLHSILFHWASTLQSSTTCIITNIGFTAMRLTRRSILIYTARPQQQVFDL